MKGRPRKAVEATSESPLLRAMQAAYNTAGKPDLRELAAASDVGYGAVYRALREGNVPDTIAGWERLLLSLGYEVVLKPVAPAKVGPPKPKPKVDPGIHVDS